MAATGEVRAYFDAHVRDITDECMVWPFNTNSGGYGMVTIDGVGYLAHVLACTAHHGPRPDGMFAAHGPCHTRRCWNGAHVSWKTPLDNSRDQYRDGTVGRKLTEEQVLTMRAAYAAGGVTQYQLADQYAVSQAAVSKIIRGEHWRFAASERYGR